MREAKKTVLVVDDEASIVEFLSLMFERDGYAVDSSDGGWPAFQMIQAKRYDFVLSDVRMIKGDGIELLENVQAMDDHPPVGLLSAFTDVATSDIFDRGAVAFLQKPIVWPTVAETVRRATKARKERWSGHPSQGELIQASWPSWSDSQKYGQLALGGGGIFLALKTAHPAVDSVVRFEFTFAAGAPSRLTGTACVRWSRGASRHGFHPGVGLEFLTLDPASLAFVLGEIQQKAPKAFVPIGYGRAPADEG